MTCIMKENIYKITVTEFYCFFKDSFVTKYRCPYLFRRHAENMTARERKGGGGDECSNNWL